MLYLESNKIPDIFFAIHQCNQFTHNTKSSQETFAKRICRYIQGTKGNGIVFNIYKKLVVDCYAYAYFAGLWGYEDPQDPICARSRTGFMVTFTIVLYCECQNYRRRFLYLHYIRSMWHCIIMIDCTNSYDSVIGIMLYLASNKILDIFFDVHQCYQFTHNTKV